MYLIAIAISGLIKMYLPSHDVARLRTEVLHCAHSIWSGSDLVSIILKGDNGHDQAYLLDSGCVHSLLFQGGAKQVKITFRLGGTQLGRLTFNQVDLNRFQPVLRVLFMKQHVVGILGEDFLQTHDVLVDYTNQAVYCSEERSPEVLPDQVITRDGAKQEALSLRGVPTVSLDSYPEGYYATVVTSPASSNRMITWMLVDTGATVSTLPSAGTPPSDATPGVINRAEFVQQGWNEIKEIEVAGAGSWPSGRDVNSEWSEARLLRTGVTFASGAMSVLRAHALGDKIFFCLRKGLIAILAGAPPPYTSAASRN